MMGSSWNFRGWSGACILLLVVQEHTLEVSATAEICHANHTDGNGGEGSCMDCAMWRNCYPGGTCDVHCSQCGDCYTNPDADGCEDCDVEKCMGCAACPEAPPGCIANCTVCAAYQDMLDCQYGPCKDCGPCYANMNAPGCDACQGCTQCASCSVMPSCHDCRCCKDVGCALCSAEDAPCPDEGYTAAELSNSWPDAPGLFYDADVDTENTNNATKVIDVILLVLLVLLFVIAITVGTIIWFNCTPIGSSTEETAILSSDKPGYGSAAVTVTTES